MRNTALTLFIRTVLAAIALATSLSASAADNTMVDTQNPTASFLDQLLSPPAPLRAATAEIANADQRPLFSLSARDTVSGAHWTFTAPQTDNPLSSLLAAGGLQKHGIGFFHATDAVAARADGNHSLGQWLMGAARNAGNVQVRATMPLDVSAQSPTDAATRAITSREVTQYLEQNSDAVTLLAKLLGWQQTGLLPSVADLQKMAANHVGAVSSSVEHWALQNVSFSSSTQAIASSDTEQPMLQWQWSITPNTNQYNSNNLADNEANFSANLRRLFGMNDYY